jgi:hypothetical protein
LLSTVIAAEPVLVNVTSVLTQTIVSGEILKLLVGLVLVVIGSIVKSENPHGFTARILIKNVLGVPPPDAPQEDELKT